MKAIRRLWMRIREYFLPSFFTERDVAAFAKALPGVCMICSFYFHCVREGVDVEKPEHDCDDVRQITAQIAAGRGEP